MINITNNKFAIEKTVPYKKIEEMFFITRFDKSLFLENIKTLRIQKEVLEKECYARYYSADNLIAIKKGRKIDNYCLAHELLHMSSNIPGDYESSRKIGVREGSFGRGLNEGITEYINSYFLFPNSSDSYYLLEELIVENLVNLYGQEMLRYYFERNQGGFINYFYNKDIEICPIMQALDNCHYSMIRNIPSPIDYKYQLDNLFDQLLMLYEKNTVDKELCLDLIDEVLNRQNYTGSMQVCGKCSVDIRKLVDSKIKSKKLVMR